MNSYSASGAIESAKIDGANELTILYKIVLPLSKPVLATIALFHIVGHWNDWFTGVVYIRDKFKLPAMVILRQIIALANAMQIVTEATGSDYTPPTKDNQYRDPDAGELEGVFQGNPEVLVADDADKIRKTDEPLREGVFNHGIIERVYKRQQVKQQETGKARYKQPYSLLPVAHGTLRYIMIK
jgi:hypothetical protein